MNELFKEFEGNTLLHVIIIIAEGSKTTFLYNNCFNNKTLV